MSRILNPKFKYVPAAATDIRKTFQRVIREQRKNEQERADKVEQLPTRRKAHG